MNTLRIRQAIKAGVYLTALMPLLVFANSTIFPFVFGKAIYFRILTEIILALYLLLLVFDQSYRPRLTPIFWAAAAWLLALILATVFGVDPARSFWGNHERMSGLFTLLHFPVFFAVLASLRWSWSEWRNFFRYLLFISLIVGFTGFNFLLAADSIMRIGGGGTLGNQIYLANFVLFHVFIAWLLWRREEKSFWRMYAAIIGIVEIAIMIYNGKRGPFLGLLLGVAVGALIYILRAGRPKQWKTKILTAAVLIAVGGSAILYAARDSTLVRAVPLVNALAHLSLRGGTAETRLIAWDIAIKAFKERPLFGWGPENYYYAFNLFYNPKSLEHGFYETWFDRSHNILFDYLSMGGVVGLAVYIGLFAVIFWQLYTKRRGLGTDELAVAAMFFSAYILQNFFVFDHLSSYLTFFIFLAFTDNLTRAASHPEPREGSRKELDSAAVNYSWMILWWAAVFLLLVTLYQGNIVPWRANTASFDAQRLLGSQQITQGLDKYREIFKKPSPHLDDIRADLARVLATSLAQNPQPLTQDRVRAGWEMAVSELKKTLEKHPREVNARLFLAQLYSLFLRDTQMAQLADQEFAEALKLSPKRQQILYHWSRVKLLQRDFDGARKLLMQARDDNPKIVVTYWYLGLTEAEAGNAVEAYRFIKDALERGYSPQADGEYLLAADIFKANKDFERARDFYEKVLAGNPTDTALMLNLSEVYMSLGDRLRAAELAERAALYDPQAREKARRWLR